MCPLLHPICWEPQPFFPILFCHSQHHKLRSGSSLPASHAGFLQGRGIWSIIIPQSNSGTKLSGACSSRFRGDVTDDDFSAVTRGPFKRQHKRFLCLTMEKWSGGFFFFLCSLKGGWETPLTTSTNLDTKFACPPFPSESQGLGRTTSPKPQQYEDVRQMGNDFPGASEAKLRSTALS